MTQIKIKDEICDIPVYMEVRDGKLYNNNTKQFEGVDGDIAVVTEYGEEKRYTVKQYTDYQVLPNYEGKTRILSAQELRDGRTILNYIHNTECEVV